MSTDMTRLLPQIASEKDYSRLLPQLEPWRPAVQEVLRRHGLASSSVSLRRGSASTYPSVLVGEREVVKLFGPWWCGPESLEAESSALALLSGSGLAVPRLLHHGSLGEGWRYLVLEQLPGAGLCALRDKLDSDALTTVAGWLGQFCQELSRIELPDSGYLGQTWTRFTDFLATRRDELTSAQESVLPPHLHTGLEQWLPPVGDLIDSDRDPVLLHGDLHDHHVFATLNGGFQVTGVIDFTDALVGDRYYEIGPLFVHTFRADRSMLAGWLVDAELPSAGTLGFPTRALAHTILHEFDPLARLRDEIQQFATLDELAEELFGI